MVIDPESVLTESNGHQMVFVGGLHRSGTSFVRNALRDHPEASAFLNTGVRQDEGQHLQSAIPADPELGGPGRFGYHPRAHLTEASPEASPRCAELLWQAWAPYWDLSRSVLVEKSPANLLRTRLLQALFPESKFVILLRHPVSTALATQKWTRNRARIRAPIGSLVAHWLHCHAVFAADSRHLRSLLVLRWEDLVASPEATATTIQRFVGLEAPIEFPPLDSTVDARYQERWRRFQRGLRRTYGQLLVRRFGERARRFGYRMEDLGIVGPLERF